MGEGRGGTRDLRMQDAIGELFDVINFVFFSNEKAKIRVGFPESFEFGCDGGNVKLVLQFSAAILEGFIMEEDDIRFGEFLAGLFGDAYVYVLVEGGIDESYIVVADDLD
jgi:hypothetical protein